MVSMDEICGYVRNYFLRDYKDPAKYIHRGTFTIANGSIQDLPFLISGQYFRIKGSALNDGVYQYGTENSLKDETFDGEIWAMYVPADFVVLVGEINDWVTANADALNGPYQSESFGGYSYSKGYAATGNGKVIASGWQGQFAIRLSRFRRLSVL